MNSIHALSPWSLPEAQLSRTRPWRRVTFPTTCNRAPSFGHIALLLSQKARLRGDDARRRSPLRQTALTPSSKEKYAKRETNMRKLICLSLSAGLLIASVDVAQA